MSIDILESDLKITDILKSLNSNFLTLILVLIELYFFHDSRNESIGQSHDSRWEKEVGENLSYN